MRGLVVALSLAAALDAPGPAPQSADVDQERSAWRFKRSVALAGSEAQGPAFAALVLPPDVGTRCQVELQDVRLVGPDGREVPYVVDRADERETGTVWPGRLIDVRPEKRARTVWVVDLGEPRGFDLVRLEIRQQDFAKRVQVEVSDDTQAWRSVREDAGVFDRPWSVRIHHTAIAFHGRITARYLRLTADDRRSKPVELHGVTVWASRSVPEERVRRPVTLLPVGAEPGANRYRLELPSGFPFEVLELDADDPAFARRVVLYEVREVNGRKQETSLGEARLYRLRIEDESLSGESLALPVRRGQGGELQLEIEGGDSPPLRNPRAFASAPATRLLFPAGSGPVALYYGNDATRAPLYDLETLKWRIGLAPSFAPTMLGPEAENPRYRKAPPLPFAAPRGAALAGPKWRALRPLAIGGREDLYTLTLAGEDLGLLRDDLGDLRIVDQESRQVPYILEPAASEVRVPLKVEKQAAPEGRGRAASRYRLAVPTSLSGKALALPLAALELAFQEPFFTRPARLLVPLPVGRRGGERSVFSGTLTRTAREKTGAPISLALDGTREKELFLEIDEGDNVPLTLITVQAVVRVPRVAFKAGPGAYRILLANAEAAPPRYDIASLRQEILAYSALPVQAGPSSANPSFRRRASDYFKDAPPTLLLWATLLVAVVALLLLTARILRQPQA